MEIAQAASEDQLNQVRQLMHAFVNWHKVRHAADLPLIERYFDGNTFAAELASLPGKYVPPPGRLLLALEEGQPAGCAALRALDAKTCEMKRMFVYPQFHGKGIGRALAETLIREARQIGYSCMRLDTGPKQFEAQALYRSLGFKEIDPYYPVSEELQHWLLFMELSL
jgi:putative acetyltransferase